MDARGFTNPDAGVIATSPATAPEAAPSTVGLPRMAHSVNIQPSAAAAVAVLVTTNALVASLPAADRKSTRLNSSHGYISYAVFCLKKKKKKYRKQSEQRYRSTYPSN